MRFGRWLSRHSGAISAAVNAVLVLNRRARAHEFVLDSMSHAIPPFLPPAMVELRRLVSRCVSPARNPPRSRVRHLRWPLSDEGGQAKKLFWGMSVPAASPMHAPPTQVVVNGSGGRVRPHSTSPFRLPRLSNRPRILLSFGGVVLPASARASTQPVAATRPMCGRPRGVEICPWRSDAIERCRAHACLAWCCPAVHKAGAGVR